MITSSQLQAATGCTDALAQIWLEPISNAMDVFNVNGPQRMAAFLAQIGHESGCLKFVKEIWGPTQVPEQVTYERDFSQAWGPTIVRGQRNFKAFGLGNAVKGDGFKYRGRGLIQTTGRGGYRKAFVGLSKILSEVPDFEANPEAMEIQKWAALSAGLFWYDHGCNAMADKGTPESFLAITKAINGGTNGMEDRLMHYNQARLVLLV